MRRSLLLYFGLFLEHAASLDNGLARTPPMGWMTWERYRCITDCSPGPTGSKCINEQLIKDMADRLAKDGWLDAGYNQVSIDDCWALPDRDEKGQQVADPVRFPSGMAKLGKYIHDRGLKFGTYSDIGSKTCAGKVGLKGHFEQDANTFASWGVDYIKVDGCYEELKDMQNDYPAFGDALNKTGRPIVYSCSWPAYLNHHCEGTDACMSALMQHCNLWRNFADVDDSWQSVLGIVNFWKRRNSSDEMVRSAGPGHWNDPDMLLVGDFGLSHSQEQTQFALWAIFAAPLFMSNDLRAISDASREILQNREIIAVNQDSLGKQGYCAAGCDGNLRVWVRELSGQDAAVVLENVDSGGDGSNITLDASMIPWFSQSPSGFFARDLYAKSDLGPFLGHLTLYVYVSSCRMLKITQKRDVNVII
mmetsp:Transcript_27339/g.63653  ORF Transcript_27339/g.63653 Transcript_27339/m.63653 type:complete len:419 (-) Transcript_27339:144-1400(-)